MTVAEGIPGPDNNQVPGLRFREGFDNSDGVVKKRTWSKVESECEAERKTDKMAQSRWGPTSVIKFRRL